MSKLSRHITLLPLIMYGVGDILGSGIYGLIGKVAGEMGNLIWVAFLVSFFIALMTGLSYAALSSRCHRAAGSSFIVWKAFRSPLLAFVIGMATLCSGLTSMATASRIFSGYLHGLAPIVPMAAGVVAFSLLLTTVVFVGIRQSLWVNTACTIIELGGLLIILIAGIPYLGTTNIMDVSSIPSGAEFTPSLVLSASVLAFYSFIGFEDLLNVSEEVVKPERTVPIALIVSMIVASSLYMLIGIVAVSVVPAAELGASSQPLVDVVRKAWPWFPTQIFSVIALFAVANTALLNYIMTSRLLYGLANLGLLPKFLSRVHRRTKTPYLSILTVLTIFLLLAFTGEIATLARATSLFVLLVFFTMNFSLIMFQRAERKGMSLVETDQADLKPWRLPQIIPILGCLGAAAMLVHANLEDYKIAGLMLGLILLFYAVRRPTAEQIEKLDGAAGHD